MLTKIDRQDLLEGFFLLSESNLPIYFENAKNLIMDDCNLIQPGVQNRGARI